MDSTTAQPLFDPTVPAFRSDPHSVFRRMREQAPVYRHVARTSGRVFWMLTRYHDVQRALSDDRLGRQLDRLPAEVAAFHRRWERDEFSMLRENVFNLDPPDHTRIRRLLTPAFSARAVAPLAGRIQQTADDLVRAMAASTAADGTVDLIASLARPLSIMVMAELLGFPADDQELLRGWVDGLLHSRDREQMKRCRVEFMAYVEDISDHRRRHPHDDVLSCLVAAEQDGDRLSSSELLSSVFQLLFAGDETTVNLTGNGVLELLRHPDQLDRLRAQPQLLDSAVEEMARFNGPVVHSRQLYAMTDLEVSGTTVSCGDIVVPVLLAANRDPAVFAEPDVFDIGRHPNRHLGFGHGIHFCLGAELARMQVRAAVAAVVGRFPELTLAVDAAELDWIPAVFLHGVRQLPLRTGAARGDTLRPAGGGPAAR